MSSAFLSQRLGRLAEQGWVDRRQERSPRGRTVYFVPKAGVSVRWLAPGEQVALHWTVRGDVDWRFPLVSQVPDEPARRALVAFLECLGLAGLLEGTPSRERGKRKKSPRCLALVVYGSTARGTARPTSDVDVLVVVARTGEGARRRVAGLAAEVSLHAPRPIQSHAVHVDLLERLPRGVRDSVRREGLVVYAAPGPRGGARGLWHFVYGSRLHG